MEWELHRIIPLSDRIEHLTLADLLRLSSAAISVANGWSLHGAKLTPKKSGGLYNAPQVRDLLLFWAVQATAVLSQLLSLTGKNGFATGLPVLTLLMSCTSGSATAMALIDITERLEYYNQIAVQLFYSDEL